MIGDVAAKISCVAAAAEPVSQAVRHKSAAFASPSPCKEAAWPDRTSEKPRPSAGDA